jgi:hypothetical protein
MPSVWAKVGIVKIKEVTRRQKIFFMNMLEKGSSKLIAHWVILNKNKYCSNKIN